MKEMHWGPRWGKRDVQKRRERIGGRGRQRGEKPTREREGKGGKENCRLSAHVCMCACMCVSVPGCVPVSTSLWSQSPFLYLLSLVMYVSCLDQHLCAFFCFPCPCHPAPRGAGLFLSSAYEGLTRSRILRS